MRTYRICHSLSLPISEVIDGLVMSASSSDKLLFRDGYTIRSMANKPYAEYVVYVDGKAIVPQDSKIYIALNKPLGITCTTDKRDPSNIIDFLGMDMRIFPIGRLDKNSSGLILLTNNGDIVNKLLRAENNHDKEYKVTLDKPYNEDFVRKMERGIPILGTLTLPCTVIPENKRTFRIILHQGLNRQIRRMCEYLGFRVVKLKRIRFMNIELGGLESGKWRLIKGNELKRLLELAGIDN